MTVKLHVLTCHCEVTVHAHELEREIPWLPLEIEFWRRMADGAPDGSYRSAYSRLEITARTRLDAMLALRQLRKA